MSAALNKKEDDGSWDLVLSAKRSLFSINLKELWQYRDLIWMFIRRDIVTVYKQTILGPVWFVIQPILTTLTYVLIFGNIAGISTDGLPKIIFYLSGIVVWTYFADTFNATSRTFIDNTSIFGKVYFPRLAMPISKTISGMVKFAIQFAFFLVILFFFWLNGSEVHPNMYILLTPFLLLLMAGLSLGLGIIFTSLTTKYRDLTFLIVFGVQLLMYATPVIYPSSVVPEKYRFILSANPLTSIVETFRYAFLGSGTFDPGALLYSLLFTVVTLIIGILIFNRMEQTFMDSV
jgi:lipopolysaccharide transport system permease protein